MKRLVTHESGRSEAYTATIAVTVCLGQDSLTEPIRLRVGFKFRDLLLLKWQGSSFFPAI